MVTDWTPQHACSTMVWWEQDRLAPPPPNGPLAPWARARRPSRDPFVFSRTKATARRYLRMTRKRCCLLFFYDGCRSGGHTSSHFLAPLAILASGGLNCGSSKRSRLGVVGTGDKDRLARSRFLKAKIMRPARREWQEGKYVRLVVGCFSQHTRSRGRVRFLLDVPMALSSFSSALDSLGFSCRGPPRPVLRRVVNAISVGARIHHPSPRQDS
jgi:hypothetical protein